MKINSSIEFLIDKLKSIPVIEDCECIGSSGNDFRLLVQYKGGTENTVNVEIYDTVTPMIVKKIAVEMKEHSNGRYSLIMAPYISEKSEQVCMDNGIGYADLSGNLLFSVGLVYISEKGNPNKFPKKRESGNIFSASSGKTSVILRKMLDNVDRVWKLQELAAEAGCSIGMAFKVKEKLCNQLWAEMTSDGLKLTDPRGLMDAWGVEYKRSTKKEMACYTLSALPEFEKKVRELHDKNGIECYLTGLSGGTRYAPIVRYNRVHVLVDSEDFDDFMEYSNCKEVDSGANVIIIEAAKDQLVGSRNITGDPVASPVQVFLDCLRIKGRGAEMADAVFKKEIEK